MTKAAGNKALLVLEWATIGAGVAAATTVLAAGYLHRPRVERDAAQPALQARSACEGGTGTLATLHAWLDGAEIPAEPSAPPPPADAAARARGATVFAAHCAACHGARGDGKGSVSVGLATPPADLTAGMFALRTTDHEALPTDLDLFRTITRGIHGTAMPPWFMLPEADRWALVVYVKSLSKAFADDEAPPPIDVSHPPEVTPQRLSHGRLVYQTAGCVSCHGADGRGNGAAANALFLHSGAPIRPRDFRVGRFHRGTRLTDSYLTLATGLDGSPMASFATVLSGDDLWDVAMYVQSMSPPARELPGGVRCLEVPAEIRCMQLPTELYCPEPTPSTDEIIGVRTLLHSFP